MEMNTRIQVEHPVTEMITGVDLLQMQMRIAMGEKITLTQKDLFIRGHAFEARINAEDPYVGFRPNPGLIKELEFPAGPGVRVDSHIYSGYKIPEFYDSMIAKLIVYGSDRKDALSKLARALNEFHVEGVQTTIPFHQALIENSAFKEGIYTTRFIEENEDLLTQAEDLRQDINLEEAAVIAAKVTIEKKRGQYDVKSSVSKEITSPWALAHKIDGCLK